ncbi:MAG: SPASM domain-containing protein [Candidatus Aminicenantes bacterium]|nr:SPASM domain-containing protein [Candidatus Aminicenantes bacterium]
MKPAGQICRKPWENFLVEANGDCYFCCFIIRPGGKIGNLTRKGLEDIWDSRKARRIRRTIARGGIPFQCQICPYFGEFKQDKSRFYRAYFFGRKIVDALFDYAQGGFTRDRVRLALKRALRRP